MICCSEHNIHTFYTCMDTFSKKNFQIMGGGGGGVLRKL